MPPRKVLSSDIREWAWATALAGIVLIPLAVDVRAWDVFRLPKEVCFLAVSIILLSLIALAGLLGKIERRDAPSYWPLYVAIPTWVGLCTLASRQPRLSIRSFLWTLGATAFMAVVSSVGRRKPLAAAGVLLVPAVPNAVLYALQELRIWNPFATQKDWEIFMLPSGRSAASEIHTMSIALLGNPTDVAGFLLPPTLALMVLAFIVRRGPRLACAAGAAVLSVIIVSTQILTAVIALSVATLVLFALSTRGSVRVAVIACALAAAAVAAAYSPVRIKLTQTVVDLSKHRYDRLMTGRMPAFIAAWDMAMDHKLTGVGPGAFAYEYFDYILRAEEHHSWLLDSPSRGINFSEVHNDHLQILAQEGIPGYLLFATILFILAAGSFRRSLRKNGEPDVGDQRREFSRIISLPLAVCFAVFAAAQFPMELPAVSVGFFFLAALSTAWRTGVESR